MNQMEDSYRHQGLRKRLVDSFRDKGISSQAVLDAMNAIPRHLFMDTALEAFAYQDRAFPIGEGQTISQPYTVAYETQLLDVRRFDKVLEIGTGSGYQACILAQMGAVVYTVERQKKLFDHFKEFNYRSRFPNIRYFFGDGYEGLPTFAPFDRIIVTAAAPLIPEKLLLQLKPGGIMVIPIGGMEGQRMFRVIKEEEGGFSQEVYDNFSFVPMLEGKRG
jgi:protein-L-isoaspartate(D-aspartate) O-methyltransferase